MVELGAKQANVAPLGDDEARQKDVSHPQKQNRQLPYSV